MTNNWEKRYRNLAAKGLISRKLWTGFFPVLPNFSICWILVLKNLGTVELKTVEISNGLFHRAKNFLQQAVYYQEWMENYNLPREF